ncbi:hypothetical protein FHS85_001161 [Rhodoligotrophos appendicifer]|uniref:hypothetical protein n=1 Tax=Rhodoligotrophos appendicifer TaxID=987056 RepID=UPI001184D40E|nr:hypothetical protein [Rhodoligotrophos appendicifer]
MKKIFLLVSVAVTLSSQPASAILMQKQKFDLETFCGDAIRKYCPKVDRDSIHALWACLSPHFLGTNPLCKATLQQIQQN